MYDHQKLWPSNPMHRLHLQAFGLGLEAIYDADDGEVAISIPQDSVWISAEEARTLRDWLNANVKD